MALHKYAPGPSSRVLPSPAHPKHTPRHATAISSATLHAPKGTRPPRSPPRLPMAVLRPCRAQGGGACRRPHLAQRPVDGPALLARRRVEEQQRVAARAQGARQAAGFCWHGTSTGRGQSCAASCQAPASCACVPLTVPCCGCSAWRPRGVHTHLAPHDLRRGGNRAPRACRLGCKAQHSRPCCPPADDASPRGCIMGHRWCPACPVSRSGCDTHVCLPYADGQMKKRRSVLVDESSVFTAPLTLQYPSSRA